MADAVIKIFFINLVSIFFPCEAPKRVVVIVGRETNNRNVAGIAASNTGGQKHELNKNMATPPPLRFSNNTRKSRF